MAPTSDVAETSAAFSGRWSGSWANTLDHLLVIERIEGRAVTLIYSWGLAPGWGITTPGYERLKGTIGDDGKLRALLSNGTEVTYTLNRDHSSLTGEFRRQGRMTPGTFKREP